MAKLPRVSLSAPEPRSIVTFDRSVEIVIVSAAGAAKELSTFETVTVLAPCRASAVGAGTEVDGAAGRAAWRR